MFEFLDIFLDILYITHIYNDKKLLIWLRLVIISLVEIFKYLSQLHLNILTKEMILN